MKSMSSNYLFEPTRWDSGAMFRVSGPRGSTKRWVQPLKEETMKVLKMVNAAIAILLSIVVTGCAAPQGGGLRPTSKQFSSQWIDITMGGMMALPSEGLALALSLKNKSSKTLQVSVAFVTPDPTQRCEVTKQLNSAQSSLFSCPQKSLTPNTDYPIEISIYSDESRKNLVDKPQTRFHFSEKDAKAFAELTRKLEAEKAK